MGCAEWRTALFTGLLHSVRNDTAGAVKQNRAVREGCGKDEVRRRHMHKKTTSLRASAATRGNPVYVARSAHIIFIAAERQRRRMNFFGVAIRKNSVIMRDVRVVSSVG